MNLPIEQSQEYDSYLVIGVYVIVFSCILLLIALINIYKHIVKSRLKYMNNHSKTEYQLFNNTCLP